MLSKKRKEIIPVLWPINKIQYLIYAVYGTLLTYWLLHPLTHKYTIRCYSIFFGKGPPDVKEHYIKCKYYCATAGCTFTSGLLDLWQHHSLVQFHSCCQLTQAVLIHVASERHQIPPRREMTPKPIIILIWPLVDLELRLVSSLNLLWNAEILGSKRLRCCGLIQVAFFQSRGSGVVCSYPNRIIGL